MGLGFYDAAFVTLGRIYGTAARSTITGITLMAGFASTIGWPIIAKFLRLKSSSLLRLQPNIAYRNDYTF